MYSDNHPTHSYMVLLYRPLCSPWQHIAFTMALHTCVWSPWQHTRAPLSVSPWQHTRVHFLCQHIVFTTAYTCMLHFPCHHGNNVIRYRLVTDVPWVLCCVYRSILLWLRMCHCLQSKSCQCMPLCTKCRYHHGYAHVNIMVLIILYLR